MGCNSKSAQSEKVLALVPRHDLRARRQSGRTSSSLMRMDRGKLARGTGEDASSAQRLMHEPLSAFAYNAATMLARQLIQHSLAAFALNDFCSCIDVVDATAHVCLLLVLHKVDLI
eukprot:scaffold2997_cov18-Tisochrysis_lutea.AAC.1